MHPGALIRRTLVALAALAATAGTGHATIILAPIATDAAILQLPDQATPAPVIAGADPAIGRFTFTSANRLVSDAATDRITGLLDFEDLSFRADDPAAIVGLSFQFDASVPPGSFAEVVALDGSGRGFAFTFPGPIAGVTTVSLLATGGETISGFRLSAPVLGSPVGPFRFVSAAPVPEPSALALGAIGLGVLALAGMRRRKSA
jgi:hypothetical protein